MKRVLAAVWAALSSRALAPVVIGFFFVLYIGVAFFTEEVLTVLMMLTRKYLVLSAILALVPINFACRAGVDLAGYLKRRRSLTGAAASWDPSLYDETVEVEPSTAIAKLDARLSAEGYRTRGGEGVVAAWRGVSLAPARILFLLAFCCLFAGIVVSLDTRTVTRQSVIEGIQFPSPSGSAGIVQRIFYRLSTGPILAKDLSIEVAGEGGRVKTLGVYPPTIVDGAFAYPRYLGIALACRFSAPDLPSGFASNDVYPIYPPGKEAVVLITGSPYKVALSLERPQDGSDPYMTGRMSFRFKVMKGPDLVLEGSVPSGEEFAKNGIRFAIADARRMVITDFVVDFGVLLIWMAGGVFCLALLTWLPLRLLFPRREMLFRATAQGITASSHAEGRGRAHTGVFHEALDFLAARQHESRLFAEE